MGDAMAEPDPLLDEDLNDADRRTVDAIESPLPQSGTGPEPGDLGDIAPEAPVAPPAEAESTAPALAPGAAAPLPGAVEPLPGMSSPIVPGSAEDISRQQGNLDVQKAGDVAKIAKEQADAAAEADEDARLERADYLQRRQDAEKDLDAKTKRYEATKLVDPRSRSPVKSKIAIAFGGLGAAYRSAGGGDANNHVLANLQKQWEDDYDLQKANISALRDQAVQARTRLTDVDEGRRTMLRDADARLLAKYNLALKQGEAQLKAHGVPQAQIDADQRIVNLRTARAAAAARAQKDADAHALNQARIEALKAKAAKDAKGKGPGRGGRGGGGGKGDAAADVADYLIEHPGDIGGAHRLAGKIGVDTKTVDKLVNQTKPSESQVKSAEFAKAGLRAVDALEKTSYKPTDNEIQKWLNNQRLVYGAQESGVKGFGLTIGQNLPGNLVPKSEVDGLSDEGKKYFADVRRLMEPLGRAKSGAAISQSEWTNFFNQYGPQSSGGYAAARKDLEDSLKLSGVAGRQLNAGNPATTGAPNAKSGPTAGTVLRLKDGRTVRARADGGYDLVSDGRR